MSFPQPSSLTTGCILPITKPHSLCFFHHTPSEDGFEGLFNACSFTRYYYHMRIYQHVSDSGFQYIDVLILSSARRRKWRVMRNSEREELDMETDSPPPRGIIFRKYRGCYVSRGIGLLLVISFVSGLVATGLLVYYLAPHPPSALPSTRRPPLLSYMPIPTTPTTTTTTTASPEVSGTSQVISRTHDRDFL